MGNHQRVEADTLGAHTSKLWNCKKGCFEVDTDGCTAFGSGQDGGTITLAGMGQPEKPQANLRHTQVFGEALVTRRPPRRLVMVKHHHHRWMKFPVLAVPLCGSEPPMQAGQPEKSVLCQLGVQALVMGRQFHGGA